MVRKVRNGQQIPLLLICTILTALLATPPVVHAQGEGQSIEVTVDITPELRSKAKPDQAVFVFAKGIKGPRAPLAAVKVKVADLPTTVTLDDSRSKPMFKFSRHKKVRVFARVSQSGGALKSRGDFEGVSPVIKLNKVGKPITVTIDYIVP
ncbi:MAG: hypothetical protein ACE5GF_00710 [Thermodesulfobacteriota bacterium]